MGCGDQENPIQIALFRSRFRHLQMRLVNGIERAAENADPDVLRPCLGTLNGDGV